MWAQAVKARPTEAIPRGAWERPSIIGGMSSDELTESVIRGLTLFHGLDAAQVASVAAGCRTTRLSRDEALFEQGDASRALFILLEGRVSIIVGQGREPLGQVGAGDTVGEVSLITGEPHTATVRVVEPVVAAVWSREALEACIGADPSVGVVLYRNLAVGLGRKLRRIDRALADWA